MAKSASLSRLRCTVKLTRTCALCVRWSSASAAGLNAASRNTDQMELPFARARLGPFFQQQPQIGNPFNDDLTLQKYLRRHLPQKIILEVFDDLKQFGHRIVTSIDTLGKECEQNPPRLEQFDAWGKRVDKIITTPAWKEMKRISAEEGLIAIAYERKYGELSRLYQMAKLYLYAPSSGLYSCPLAMTDGAAKSIEVLGKSKLLQTAFDHLTNRDPAKFWTSGQWMTERKGGSDVATGTQTMAIKQSDDSYKLYGYKWFSSATDSDMSFTLGRICDDNGNVRQGTTGLSMFYLEVRDSNGNLNNIEVQRLKNKLGTRPVPTAELLLDGTKAYRVSEEGRGVAAISSMLTLTRIHNALSSAGAMRRVIVLARDYSMKRECFGKTIIDHKLHVKNLANMEIEARAATLLTLECARLLGLDDCNMLSAVDRDVFRLLTPLAKLYTAKQAMSVVSEGLECFGGMGYLEDTGLPVILRDAQVLPIWEGTTNILSLDVLRAIQKSRGEALVTFANEVLRRATLVKSNGPHQLHQCAANVEQSIEKIVQFAKQHPTQLEVAAREFSLSLARTFMGLLLVEQAAWSGASNDDVLAAIRWSQKDLCPVSSQSKLLNYDDRTTHAEHQLVYAGYIPTSKL